MIHWGGAYPDEDNDRIHFKVATFKDNEDKVYFKMDLDWFEKTRAMRRPIY